MDFIEQKQALELIKKYLDKKYGKMVSMEPIHNGYTNQSWLVTYSTNRKFQVRIAHALTNIDRSAELQVLKLVGDNSFIYFDKKTGNAIKRWIEGKNPRIWKIFKWSRIDELFSKIKKIHQTKLPKRSLVKKLDFEAYNSNLFRLKFKYQTKFLSILDTYRDDVRVLSHTDINPLNIIVGDDGKLHLIDYEWAGLVSEYWDYANFIRETGIGWYDKLDWSKYIDHFSMDKLKDYIFAASVYAYLWTWKMEQTPKIKGYRRSVLKQIHIYAKGLFKDEK